MSNTVEFSGDWQSLKRVLDGCGTKLKRESRKTIGRQIKLIEARVLGHIDKQDLQWPALDEKYKARKERKGLSPDILRASNQMYANITTDQPNDFEGACGVKRGVKEKGGQDVTDIALIHENPEDRPRKRGKDRKLWKPTFEEVKPGVEAALKGIVIEVFKK